VRVLKWVITVEDRPQSTGSGRERVATLAGGPLNGPPALVEVVEGIVDLEDGDPLFARRERHEHLGLSFGHPRWAATVLCNESDLAFPDLSWSQAELAPPDATLPPATATGWSSGEDLNDKIVPEDFFAAVVPATAHRAGRRHRATSLCRAAVGKTALPVQRRRMAGR